MRDGLATLTNVFVSYSHKDTRWLNRLLTHLKPLERQNHIDVWADTRINPGDRWVAEIESALSRTRVAVLLVSADFLASEFITSKELPALLRKAQQKNCSILPIIVGPCLFSAMRDLQQFQAVNSPDRPLAKMRKADAELTLVKLAETILARTTLGPSTYDEPSSIAGKATPVAIQKFAGNPNIDDLIKDIRLADWELASQVAIKIIAKTDSSGCNQIFDSLLNYQDCPDDDDRFWGASHTIESCIRLAPWLIDHTRLSRMATHSNFSVRSSAASICMDLAHSAPDRVPLDIVMSLSVYDEDWYVEAPATAALKAMARAFPDVLRIFYGRLRSPKEEERAHAASAIESVAKEEPELIDSELLSVEIDHLVRLEDTQTVGRLRKTLTKVKSVNHRHRYRYGL